MSKNPDLRARCRQGFTIVELMLAMSFVAVLLIAIAALTIGMTHIYTRGTTLKELAEAGIAVTSDMSATLRQAQPANIVTSSVDGHVRAICTGSYTYVINDPTAVENDTTASLITIGDTPIRLAKLVDVGSTVCAAGSGWFDGAPDLSSTPTYAARELLPAGDRELLVDSMTLQVPHDDACRSSNGDLHYLCQLSVTLRSPRSSEVVGSSCRPPSDVDSNIDFCAIGTFPVMFQVNSSGMKT